MATIEHARFHADIPPGTTGVHTRSLLPGSVRGVEVEACIVPPSCGHTLVPREGTAVIILFLAGRAACTAGEKAFAVESPFIAASCTGTPFNISPAGEESLAAVIVHKDLSPADEDRLSRPPFGEEEPYLRAFSRCRRYREDIKSEKTENTTLLPGGVVPRAAVGSVRTLGPDEVAPHAHRGLEQFFLGLAGCRCTVRADGSSCILTEYTLLHIPRDSTHAVSIAPGDTCHYVWMDFFRSAEDEAMLSRHVPIEEE